MSLSKDGLNELLEELKKEELKNTVLQRFISSLVKIFAPLM